MKVEALIKEAFDKGVKLSVVGDRLKYAGEREAVNALLEPLRHHKAALIHWFQAESASTVIVNPEPQRLFRHRGPWLTDRESIAAREYHEHHFKCPACIAAGRGTRYGQRCGAGMALWSVYQDGQSPTSKGQSK